MDNFVVVQGWMTGLDLKASEILALALIWGFTQDGQHSCHASLQYIGRFSAIKEKAAVSRMLKRMAEKGIITIDRTDGGISEYRVSELLSKQQRGVVETTTGCCRNDNGVLSKRQRGVVETTTPYNNVYNKSIINIDNVAAVPEGPSPTRARSRRKGEVPPTLEEVKEYAAKHGVSEKLATDFWLHYEGVGWMSSKTPIKTWYPIFLKWAGNAPEGR